MIATHAAVENKRRIPNPRRRIDCRPYLQRDRVRLGCPD
jgi:hypothetical protein